MSEALRPKELGHLPDLAPYPTIDVCLYLWGDLSLVVVSAHLRAQIVLIIYSGTVFGELFFNRRHPER